MKKVAPSPSPPIGLIETDRREVCGLHGWVGRKVYQRDRHDLCEAPVEEEPPVEDEDDEHEPEPLLNLSRESPRSRGIPPKRTVAVRRITQVQLAAGREELVKLGADQPYERPKTRGDCANIQRPCPYIACKHNLYLDVSETGSIILNFPHLEPGQMPADQSCALDLAERGGMTLEEIALVTNLTRERIRQVELKALIRRARPAAVALGLGADDVAAADGRRQVGPGQDLAETGVDGELPTDVAALLSGK